MMIVIQRSRHDRDRSPIDLFSLDTRRHRVVEWQAPGPVAKAAAGMSGLETMCAIRDGILPPPPMARLIGFGCASPNPAGS